MRQDLLPPLEEPGNKNWVGQGAWKEAEVLISHVSVCPFNERHDGESFRSLSFFLFILNVPLLGFYSMSQF